MNEAHSDVTPPQAVDTAADNQQVIYYEGSPSLLGELGTVLTCALIALVIAAIPFLLALANVNVHWVAYLVAIVIALLVLGYPALKVLGFHYRVTNYRIDFEQGIIFKKLDTLELWHVEDVSLSMGPIQRMLSVGTIRVCSSDETTPILDLRSVRGPRKLLETLKQRIIAVKRQRGVLKINEGMAHQHLES